VFSPDVPPPPTVGLAGCAGPAVESSVVARVKDSFFACYDCASTRRHALGSARWGMRWGELPKVLLFQLATGAVAAAGPMPTSA
jgi:hypothetical protein